MCTVHAHVDGLDAACLRNQLGLTAHVLASQHTMDTAKRAAVPYRNPPSETMPSPEKAPLPLPRPDQHRHAGAPLPTSQRLSRCLVARAAATRPASLPSCPQITLSAKGMPGRPAFGIWRATRRSLCCAHCLIFREPEPSLAHCQPTTLPTPLRQTRAAVQRPFRPSLVVIHRSRPPVTARAVARDPHGFTPSTPEPSSSSSSSRIRAPARNSQGETRSPAVFSTSNRNPLPHPLL